MSFNAFDTLLKRYELAIITTCANVLTSVSLAIYETDRQV